MPKILLKNGQVVSSEGVKNLDLMIENGKIIEIIKSDVIIPEVLEMMKETDFKEIDLKGKYVLPGIIDVHVHFRTPGHEHKEDFTTGSEAAVAGGVTTVLDMPNNVPPTINARTLKAKRNLINGKTYANYGLYIGFDGENFEEIEKAKNVAGIKVYVGSSTASGHTGYESLKKLLEVTDKLVVVHAEDQGIIDESLGRTLVGVDGVDVPASVHSKIRPVHAEVRAITYVCDMAKKYGKRVHIAHVSSEEGLKVVSQYREFGVTCEVTPHHLTFNREDYEKLGNFLKVNPPIRDQEDIFALWKGLKSGDIDIIATDHAPHTIEEKSLPYEKAPSGVPGLETSLAVMLNAVNDKAMDISEVVKLMCENPAKIFGLKTKGKLEKWYDADITVVDIDLEKAVDNKKLFTKCKWSPYNGTSFKGWPVMTFVAGELVYKEGKIVGGMNGKEVLF